MCIDAEEDIAEINAKETIVTSTTNKKRIVGHRFLIRNMLEHISGWAVNNDEKTNNTDKMKELFLYEKL